jgi:hypothetical protein
MMTSRKWWKLLVVFVVLCLCVVALSVYGIRGWPKQGASDLFRQYVLDPVPASVTHIRADQPKLTGGYGYVFQFAVNVADLKVICKSRPFRQAENMHLLDGNGLSWDWKGWDREESSQKERGSAFMIYQMRRKPSWFDLEAWDNPEMYALTQKDKDGNTSDIQILIYNSQLGQAYSIVFHYGGGRRPFFWGG